MNTLISTKFKHSLRFTLLLLFFGTTGILAQQNATSSKSHADTEGWVEYLEGNMPLVISVPHGGRIVVDSLAIRDCKGAVTVTDVNTIELAMAIKNYLEKTYRLSPHLIISHLSRKHLDQNRELDNGASCGDKRVEKAWYRFHNWVDTALKMASQNGQRAMYIDLHGHGHKNQRLEIGYNMSREQLEQLWNNALDIKNSKNSLQNLLKLENQLELKDLVFGEHAFGTVLVKQGLAATPSALDLVPQKGEPFFSGGDNTRRFTSRNYPNVFGLQIECDKTTRSKEKRPTAAKAIAEASVHYLNRFAKTVINAK